MENLEKIYERFKEEGLANSQYEFSINWLGKNKSYLSWLKASGSDPSIEALSYLFFELEGRVQKEHEQNGPGHSAAALNVLMSAKEKAKNWLIDGFAEARHHKMLNGEGR